MNFDRICNVNPISCNLFCNLIASSIFAVGIYFLFRRSFYKTINRVLSADKSLNRLNSSIRGARSSIDTAHTNIGSELSDPSVPPTVKNWLTAELQGIKTSVDDAHSEIDVLRGRLLALKALEKKDG